MPSSAVHSPVSDLEQKANLAFAEYHDDGHLSEDHKHSLMWQIITTTFAIYEHDKKQGAHNFDKFISMKHVDPKLVDTFYEAAKIVAWGGYDLLMGNAQPVFA